MKPEPQRVFRGIGGLTFVLLAIWTGFGGCSSGEVADQGRGANNDPRPGRGRSSSAATGRSVLRRDSSNLER